MKRALLILAVLLFCQVASTQERSWIKVEKISYMGDEIGLDTLRQDNLKPPDSVLILPNGICIPRDTLEQVWELLLEQRRLLNGMDNFLDKKINAITDTLWSPKGHWYFQLEVPYIDLTIKIRMDTLWQMADSVWIEEEDQW